MIEELTELDTEFSCLSRNIHTSDRNWLEMQCAKVSTLISIAKSEAHMERRMKETGISRKPGGGFIYTKS